jgi:hypothetical protein
MEISQSFNSDPRREKARAYAREYYQKHKNSWREMYLEKKQNVLEKNARVMCEICNSEVPNIEKHSKTKIHMRAEKHRVQTLV